MNELEITLKLVLAIILGGLIGLERQAREKPAGFRTHILICVGSAMMMVLSDLIYKGRGTGVNDLTRIAAGVITGMGFIGAGTIIQSRGMIHGLTTAATLWAVAGLGLVIGAGFYWIGIIFTFLVILTLVVFRKIENKYLKTETYNYTLKTQNPKDVLDKLNSLAHDLVIKFENLTLKKDDTFSTIHFTFTSSEVKNHKFNEGLIDSESVREMNID